MGKRGTQCSVCGSKYRAQIDIGLVHRVPARVLAARFDVSKDAVHRHKSHLSPVQRAALLTAQRPATAVDLEQLRVSESEGLLSQLVSQRARLQQSAELALELGDVRASVAAEGAITANLSLVGKLLGQLIQRHDVRHSSVLLTPDYLRLRQALIAALKPFPDAARAVGQALHRLESEAARDITDAAKAPVIEHQAMAPPVTISPPRAAIEETVQAKANAKMREAKIGNQNAVKNKPPSDRGQVVLPPPPFVAAPPPVPVVNSKAQPC